MEIHGDPLDMLLGGPENPCVPSSNLGPATIDLRNGSHLPSKGIGSHFHFPRAASGGPLYRPISAQIVRVQKE